MSARNPTADVGIQQLLPTARARASGSRTTGVPTAINNLCVRWALVLVACSIIGTLAVYMHTTGVPTWSDFTASAESPSLQSNESISDKGHTLVMYLYSNSDEYYPDNLRFFVEHGMPGCPGCTYVIIVNEDDVDDDDLVAALPELPSNARYVRHANECFDWGTYGWAFKTGVVKPDDYKHFIFLNSSVRGPFLPPYFQGQMHFTELFIRKITAQVKLVGPLISCGRFDRPILPTTGENPHVQSYAVGTDRTGLDILLRNGTVFDCYDDKYLTIFHSEYAMSDAIMRAGYNLDCFLAAYQGMDWRNLSNWGCNAGRNPYDVAFVDEVPFSLMEVMFVKVKSQLVKTENALAKAAVAYDNWYNRATVT